MSIPSWLHFVFCIFFSFLNYIYVISFQAFPINKYRDILSAYWQVDCHEHVTEVAEIILGESKAYIFFEKNFGDLHSYVRSKKRLKEEEACRLFKQIIQAVQHCHENGIVLRDLKLRKFVFKDEAR